MNAERRAALIEGLRYVVLCGAVASAWALIGFFLTLAAVRSS